MTATVHTFPARVRPHQARHSTQPLQSHQAHTAPRLALFFRHLATGEIHNSVVHSSFDIGLHCTPEQLAAHIQALRGGFHSVGCELLQGQLLLSAAVEVIAVQEPGMSEFAQDRAQGLFSE
jgi:hypothetical protein